MSFPWDCVPLLLPPVWPPTTLLSVCIRPYLLPWVSTHRVLFHIPFSIRSDCLVNLRHGYLSLDGCFIFRNRHTWTRLFFISTPVTKGTCYRIGFPSSNKGMSDKPTGLTTDHREEINRTIVTYMTYGGVGLRHLLYDVLEYFKDWVKIRLSEDQPVRICIHIGIRKRGKDVVVEVGTTVLRTDLKTSVGSGPT